MIKTYSELITIPTFIERYRYLKVGQRVGGETFGWERYLNQEFYRSSLWRNEIRPKVIERDKACDLAHRDHVIPDGCTVIVHHINPLTEYDIINQTSYLTDLEYLITTVVATHNAIHYGDEKMLSDIVTERRPYDTCPWRL